MRAASKPTCLRDAAHETHEIGGRHAGVAAVLVHLVAGGLEQHHAIVVLERMAQRCFDDDGVRAADGRHAHGVALRLWRAMRSSSAFMRRLPSRRGPLRLEHQQQRGDQRQRQAQDLERAGNGAREGQRQHRGDQRCAGIGQRRNDNRLAVPERIHQRQRADGVQ